MTALLAHLRNRPWLGPCLILLTIGVSVAVTNPFPYLLFWAGILFVAGGLLTAVAGQLGQKHGR